MWPQNEMRRVDESGKLERKTGANESWLIECLVKMRPIVVCLTNVDSPLAKVRFGQQERPTSNDERKSWPTDGQMAGTLGSKAVKLLQHSWRTIWIGPNIRAQQQKCAVGLEAIAPKGHLNRNENNVSEEKWTTGMPQSNRPNTSRHLISRSMQVKHGPSALRWSRSKGHVWTRHTLGTKRLTRSKRQLLLN